MNRLIRKLNRDGNIYPVVINYLKNLPESTLHYKDHKMRHPLSIYSISLEKVLNSFSLLLDELETIFKIPITIENNQYQFNYSLKNITKLQEDLLLALLSHIEDLYHILKSIHPAVNASESSYFVEKWLKKVKHPTVERFTQNISDYRQSFALIVNRVKHQHGQLRPIVFSPIKEGILIYDPITKIHYNTNQHTIKIVGYYIEGLQNDGSIGPDHEIHPNNTAISLNYDLKYHFAHLYILSLHLKTAIVQYLRKSHNIDLDKPRNVQIPNLDNKVNLNAVASRISKLPCLYFENEFTQDTPEILYESKDNNIILTIDYPSPHKFFWIGDHAMYGEFTVDAVNLEYRLPYAKKYLTQRDELQIWMKD